jgi:hypothetical protein
MLVPSTPRWDIRLRAIWRIRRLVAEPSPGAAAACPPTAGVGAFAWARDDSDSIVVFTDPPLVDL